MMYAAIGPDGEDECPAVNGRLNHGPVLRWPFLLGLPALALDTFHCGNLPSQRFQFGDQLFFVLSWSFMTGLSWIPYLATP